jgi:SAM-dependent methyltransferase
MAAARESGEAWLRRKLATFRFDRRSRRPALAADADDLPFPSHSEPLFANPFSIGDIDVFDSRTLADLLGADDAGVDATDLGDSAAAMPVALRRRVRAALGGARRRRFDAAVRRRRPVADRRAAERRVLDALFWELTYWKTPELYEELTEGERIHPGIFRRLAPRIEDAVVLDAGAGSGRASLECVRYGARRVIALEPSAGLLRLLKEKTHQGRSAGRVAPLRGRFDAIPLVDGSVDIVLACSAFTADPGQGGEPGLAELRRVTRPGGRVVVIWPRVEDHEWLARQGFRYEPLPLDREMVVRFRSLASAWRCARRFYARRHDVVRYLRRHRRPEVPFSVLGFNPPHDFCWLPVE